MTDKEKIRAEIQRLKDEGGIGLNEYDMGYENGKGELCNHLLHFLDSLPEESTPKGYDEAYLNECIAKASKTWEGVDVDKYMDEVRGRESDDLEEAVDAEIVKDIHNLLHVKSGPLPMPSEHKFGDKVRIIILPEEEQ